MPLAHKPVMLRDSDHNTSSYCSVCGQENLDSDCPGEYVLSAKEQKYIDNVFTADMLKIFGGFPGSNADFYKKQKTVKSR